MAACTHTPPLQSTDLALAFVKACIQDQSPTKMRAFSSPTFQCLSKWNNGVEVRWENIEQMIGGLKLGCWKNETQEFAYRSYPETPNIIFATHEEKPASDPSSTFKKVTNSWIFVFGAEEKTINQVTVETIVSS